METDPALYRPIALLNSDLKLLTFWGGSKKCLTKLNGIISVLQEFGIGESLSL